VKAAQVMTDVGRRVTELRQARGWTQESLAERLRVDARTLQRVEAGRNLTVLMLIQLANAFGVPIGQLFDAPAGHASRKAGRPKSGADVSQTDVGTLAERPRRPVKRRKTRPESG
jgi:transcriptional regulator with XRE-family HTH domain